MMASSSSSEKPSKPALDINNQSVIIDGKPEHRASVRANPPDYYTFGDEDTEECHVVYEFLERGKRLSENGPCLGSRTGPNKEYVWMSYQEVIDKVHQFGSGLLQTGSSPSNDTNIGIYVKNRPEWTIADFGCQAYSMVSVPLYDSFGVEACAYILDHCGIKVVVTDTTEQVQKLVSMKEKAPQLSLIIAIESVPDDVINAVKAQNIEFLQYTELLELGQKNLKDPVVPKPSDLVSICPTSGTTGNPKGAMLTHENFVVMIKSVYFHISSGVPVGPGDYHLSYLPLAHNFERSVHWLVISQGASIGYFSGDIKFLADDMATLRPTLFASVPRLLSRIYDNVQMQVKNSFIKSKMLNWALASKIKDVNKSIVRRDTMWDKLIFKKVQNRLGGRVRLVITGSAPLSVDVMNFLRCALGCHVLEGYGQTEAGAGLTFTSVGDPSVGSVGPPIPGCHVKLVDVPEMDYFVKDNVGEMLQIFMSVKSHKGLVCAKGKMVFQGYYKNKEKTEEALDEEGWLHTGDIGTWMPNGTLKIIDRKKNIFKLSQGEYIAPEKIETIYRGCPFVAQCYVDGNSLKSCIMGIVVPDVDYLAVWAKNNSFPSTMEEFCNKKESKDLVLKEIRQHGEKSGLTSLEQVKDIVLEPQLFSIDNDFLTPTLKNKRAVLRKHYAQAIDDLYSAHDL